MNVCLQTRLGFVCFGSWLDSWQENRSALQSVSEEHFEGFLHNLKNRSRAVKRGKLLPEQTGGTSKEMSNEQKKNLSSTLVKCTELELNAVVRCAKKDLHMSSSLQEMYTNVEWFSQGYNMSENVMLNISCNSVQKKASVNNLKSSNRLWNNRNQPRYNIRRLHIPNKATNSLYRKSDQVYSRVYSG